MQPKQTILVVDDDPRILQLVRVNLEKAGFIVSTASGGAAAIEQFDLEVPDAIVVDVTMPGMDGFTFTQRIREASNLPIIFLTAMGEQSQKVHGLELGADDYVTKPFDPEELVARVRALLRRSSAAASHDTAGGHIIQAGGLVIDFLKHRVEYNGEQVKLTPTE